MKVSPEYFIQLSHRVNTLHKEKEKFIESPSKKGQRKHCKPGSKDRVDIFICILTSPGQGIGTYDQRNQLFKTGNNTST